MMSGSCRQSAQPASHPARCRAPLQAVGERCVAARRGWAGEKVAQIGVTR